MDNRKIIVSFYLTCSMLLWFLSRSSLQFLYTTSYQIKKFAAFRTIQEALPVVLGFGLFVVLMKHPKVNLVLDEVVSELKKVTWPKREDVVKSTTVVLICIMIASFILAGFDLVWGKLIGFFLKG